MKKLFLFSLLLFGACAPTNPKIFDRKLYKDWEWTDEKLRKVQFYLSEDLVIYRYLEKGEVLHVNDKGSIQIINGKRAQRIFFAMGKKGTFVFHPNGNNEHFAISFEPGRDDLYLTFGPNPKYDGQYLLQAKKWEKGVGIITYEGKDFFFDTQVVPSIIVDLGAIKKEETLTRSVKGRKVGQ